MQTPRRLRKSFRFFHISICAALMLVTLTLATGTFVAHAQISGSIRTDFKVYPEPAPPALPRAGGKVLDPVFGAEIMRVTDESDGTEGKTAYSYWPTFNRDNTRILAQIHPAAAIYSFNPTTFQLGAKQFLAPTSDGAQLSTEDAIWSGTEPDVLYGHTATKIWAYNVASNSYTLVGNLQGKIPAGDYINQMSMSRDNDIFAFTRRNSSYQVSGYLVYRRSTASVLYQVDVNSLDEVQIDKSGRFLVVKTGEQGAGKVEVKIKDLQTGALTDLQDGAPDYAPGHSDNGTGTVVGADSWRAHLTTRQLSSPHDVRTALDLTPQQDYGSYHVSMLADNERWALLSLDGRTANGVLQNELVQVATDGSGRVRRLLHHHSMYREYYDSSRANISRDGRFVAFTSNWGTNRRDLFVARIPAASEESATPTPTATPVTTPTPPPPVSLPVQNVVWTNLVNSTAVGNSLQKTTGCDGCADAGGTSVQTITADGYLEFTAIGTTTLRLAGLHHPAGASNFSALNFAIQLNNSGSAEVRENGAYRSETAYQGGDVFRIAVQGGAVKYFKNGAVFYTSTAAPVYPLLASGTLVNLNATIGNAVIAVNSTSNATPTPTPTATPTPTPTPTPAPFVSPSLISAALANATALANNANSTEAQIASLVTQIGQAHAAFVSEASRMAAADHIDRALRMALYFSRAAGALTTAGAPGVAVQNRLQIAASRLSQALSLTPSAGAAVSNADYAHLPAANVPPIIGAASTLSSASLAPVLSPQSLGTINGNTSQSPLALSSVTADASGAKPLPFELAGASVSINGRAARLLHVSPSRVSFLVPQGMPAGEVEVIVTSQDGYVSRGTANINAVAPALFTADASGAGQTLAMNGGAPGSTSFDVHSPHALGADKRTRLMLFATGVSAAAANLSADNDVRAESGTIANVAESVTAEARTADGRVYYLPVEFAGAQGRLPGLDQINVVLLPELRGAGLVDLTILISGQRSNTTAINIK